MQNTPTYIPIMNRLIKQFVIERGSESTSQGGDKSSNVSPARVHQQNSNAAVCDHCQATQQHNIYTVNNTVTQQHSKQRKLYPGFMSHIPRGSISKIAMLLCCLTVITHSSIAILLMDPRGGHIATFAKS